MYTEQAKACDALMSWIREFIKGNEQKIERTYKTGYHISLSKQQADGETLINISTSGYDDTMTIDDAMDWLQWEAQDRAINNCLVA